MSKAESQIRVRLPVEMQKWLGQRAEENFRTVGAEIAVLVRKEMAAGEDLGGNAPAAE